MSTQKIIVVIQMFCACMSIQEVTAQWSIIPYSGNGNNHAVTFTDADTGFIAAGNQILKTTNAGTIWIASQVANSVRSLSFPTAQIGFAAGKAVYKTTDGGGAWDSIYVPAKALGNGEVKALGFASVERGVIAGDIEGEWTQDEGETWVVCRTSVEFYVGRSSTVVFLDDTTAIVDLWMESSNSIGMVFKTTDSGQNWFPLDGWISQSGALGLRILTLFCNGTENWWLGGHRSPNSWRSYKDSRIFFTTDSGETWDTTKFVFPYTVNTIVFANDLVGFIGDTAGNIYSTIDGGATWKNDNVPSGGKSINSIAVAGGLAVYAVGDSGLILKRDIPTSVNEEHVAVGVDIFPNPTSGRVRIRINNYVGEAVVTINDVLGREVYAATLQQNDADVDLGSLPRGMYAVQVRIGGNVKSNLLVLGRE